MKYFNHNKSSVIGQEAEGHWGGIGLCQGASRQGPGWALHRREEGPGGWARSHQLQQENSSDGGGARLSHRETQHFYHQGLDFFFERTIKKIRSSTRPRRTLTSLSVVAKSLKLAPIRTRSAWRSRRTLSRRPSPSPRRLTRSKLLNQLIVLLE